MLNLCHLLVIVFPLELPHIVFQLALLLLHLAELSLQSRHIIHAFVGELVAVRREGRGCPVELVILLDLVGQRRPQLLDIADELALLPCIPIDLLL